MKNKILVMLVASVLCIAFIGGCFALYIIDAEEKDITLTTGDSISLTWGGNTSHDATVNPDNKITIWTLDLTTTQEVSDTSKYGKFSLTFENGISSMLNVATTIGGQSYDKADLVEGVHIKLSEVYDPSLTVTLSFYFAGDDAGWESWAEQVATVTANWVIDESYTGSAWVPAVGWYLVGRINDVESWAVHTDGANAKYKLNVIDDDYDKSIGNTVTYGQDRAWIEDVQLKAGDAIKILRYYEDNGIKSVWEGNFMGVNGDGYGAMQFDNNGNLIINQTGSYDIYVNADWQIYIDYNINP